MNVIPDDFYAVIMAGGSGTRFWPQSRSARPKQLIDILGGGTMIQATVARLQPLIPPDRVLVVTTAALADETRRQLPMLRPEQVIAEPVGRDTAACVCLAAVIVERMRPDAVMALLPADHVIQTADAFQRALAAGADLARQGELVTFGITPREPATGYGYIKVGEALPVQGAAANRVARFVEKPDLETARAYLADGDYRWNAGIFCWKSSTVLSELDQHCGWLTQALRPLGQHWRAPSFDERLADVYGPLKRVSIDYALMEKARRIAVVTGDFSWDDVGSWDALYDHLAKDSQGVIRRGAATSVNCRDSLLVSDNGPMVVGVDLEGITVVATADAVLVVPRGRSQDVKQAVDLLKQAGAQRLL